MSPTPPRFDAALARTHWERLAPTEAAGSSLLVVGGAAVTRDEALRALRSCAEARATSPRPVLLVAVPAPAPEASLAAPSLDEAARDAVEQALRRVGAPGALHEPAPARRRGRRATNPGAAGAAGASSLAPLVASWVFRARAAGRSGLVLLLDEVDRWLDGRGARPLAGDDEPGAGSALAWLDDALDATAGAPLSLAASVRAGDERGAPAIPGSVAGRFASQLSLGGAPVVRRDPQALVARLAGRTFTPRALQRALLGWLELAPHERDEAVVHFVAAPAPAPAPAAAEPVEPAPASVAPTRASPVEPAPRPAATPPLAPAAPLDEPPVRTEPRDGPVTAQTGETWRAGVRAAVTLRDTLAAYRALPTPHRGYARLERSFRDVASRLPLALEALARGEREVGLAPTRTRAEALRALRSFEAEFASYYDDAFAAWLAGAPRPAMLCDVPALLAREAAARGARGSALLVLTGLRVDAWQRLEPLLARRLPGLRAVSRGALFAGSPTTPAAQRELLARGLEALAAPLPPRDEAPAAKSLAESARPRREHLGHVDAHRCDAYAFALQRPGVTLAEGLAAAERALPGALAAWLATLPADTLVALCGDTGLTDALAPDALPAPRDAAGDSGKSPAPASGVANTVAGAAKRRPRARDEGGGTSAASAAGPRFVFGSHAPSAVVVPYAIMHWTGGPLATTRGADDPSEHADGAPHDDETPAGGVEAR